MKAEIFIEYLYLYLIDRTEILISEHWKAGQTKYIGMMEFQWNTLSNLFDQGTGIPVFN